MTYHRLARNGERAVVCPSCGAMHRLEGAPGRITCRCGATLETMRLLDKPQTNPRGHWYIDASGTATRL